VAAVIGGRPAWSYRAPARATVAPYDRHRLLSLAQLAAAYHVDLRAPAPAANMQLDAAGAPGRDLDVLAHLDGLAAVCGALRSVIAARGLTAAFERQEMPLAVSLAAMEVAGVGFDVAGLDAASAAAAAHMALLEDEAHQVAGRVFDLGSPDEVAQVLFEHLGLKRPDPEDLPHVQRAAARAGAGGADADAGVDVQYREEQTLQAMLPQGHPVVGILLEHKKLVRAQAGIVARLRDAALSTAQRDGVVAALPGGAGGAEARLPGGLGAADASLHRIHSLLSQIGTGTGRISSAYPNLQNIPNPERFGLDAAGAPVLNIRRLFRPAGRRTVLMAVDFAQIEMRVMAHASGDASMLRVFGSAEAAAAATAAAATAAATTPVPTAAVPAWASGDIYRQMAAQIFGLASPASVTSAQRNTAKTLTLGLIYGMGHAAAARKLGIPQQEAYELKEAFLLRFPGVGLFFSNARMFAARYGHVLTLAGRQRLLPDIICDDDGRRMYAQRQAVNSIIQGTAADLIKLAMNLVDARLRTGAGGVGPGRSDGGTAPPRGRLLLQIHDELLLECPDEPDAIRALAREVTRIMTVEVPAALEAIALAGPFAPPTGAAAADEYHRAARLILGGSARLRVPLAVSVEVGPDWGSMRPYRVE
jgi:DNA polymerase-1